MLNAKICFQVWSLATSDGAGIIFEPYCGAATNLPDLHMGQGPNVVAGLVSKADLNPGSSIFFDNLFTSFPLLQHLSQLGIGGTGTVRQNRLHRVPIMTKKEMEKKAVPRGETDVLYMKDVVLVAWKDNKAVYMASNKYEADIGDPCKRYDRVLKRKKDVPCPAVVGENFGLVLPLYDSSSHTLSAFYHSLTT